MQYTENYSLKLPGYGDNADVGDLNDNTTAIDALIHANRQIEAPAFSTTTAYTAGEMCVYENVLYKFTADKAAGNWDSTKVTATNLADEVTDAAQSGGTEVEANPDESATADLHKLKVENTVYGIPDPTVTKTVTGNPIEITDGAVAPLVKCVTAITGSQDLHGYDKPWVGGAGKNKFNQVDTTTYGLSNTNGTYTNTLTDSKTSYQPTVRWYKNGTFVNANIGTNITSSGRYRLTVNVGGQEYDEIRFGHNGSTRDLIILYPLGYNTTNIMTISFTVDGFNPSVVGGLTISEIELEIGQKTTPDPYEPYANICPITAYTEGEIEVSDGDGNTTTHTTTYPSAIYRGSEDVVNGEVTSEMPVIDLGDLTWNYANNTFYAMAPSDSYKYKTNVPSLCSHYNYIGTISNGTSDMQNVDDASYALYFNTNYPTSRVLYVKDTRYTDASTFTTAVTGVKLTYELVTPTTSSVTPTNLPIKSLSGYNHIESSTGDMEVEYITQTYQPLVDLIDEAAEQRETYSTDEQEVGTWVDGSKLYQKTYTFSGTGAANPFSTTVDMTGKTITNVIPHYAKYTYGGGTVGYCIGSRLTANNSNVLTVQYNDDIPTTLDVIANLGSTETYEVCFTVQYVKTSSNTRTLSKGSTDSLKADLSEVKDESEESVDKVDKVDEPTETIEEKEENAGESNSENER